MLRRLTPFLLTLLLIEFLDELVYGARETAWPLIRDDLGLSYLQVGLLLSIPGFTSNFIEPVIGVLGDVWKRRALVLGGGIFFGAAMLMTALSGNFYLLLLAFTLMSPASGAFVSLSQAALMDAQPERREHNMARWTFAGSLGVVAGPLALGAAVWLGTGWRGLFVAFAVLTLLLLLIARRFPFAVFPHQTGPEAPVSRGFRAGFRGAFLALRRRSVIRWLILLEFSDLMLDILYGFLALYFVDVVGSSPARAGVAVLVWTGVGLLGDFLLIPLLERVRGLDYLRVSVLLELVLYPAFLLWPGFLGKVILLGLLGLFNAGWYSILKGRLYKSMPGQSGSVMMVGSVSGLFGQLLPLGIGYAAQGWGLGSAMWILLLGPVVLILGISGRISQRKEVDNEA